MNYTTQYDKQLLNQFEHLHRHPQLLPFIGAEWNDSRHKLLLVAESHYLPEKYNYQIGYSEWNDLSYLKSLDDNKIFDWTNTRKNVEGVVEKWGHRMHNGLSRSLINVFNYNSKMEAYRNISYYNYFQRPAHEEGGSIKGYTTSDDDDLAFDFYKVIVNVLKPQWVIFLSKPA
ncbi:MAG: hypothetical protein JJ909_12780, partial [Roseivirga sp.]|nr:hypothetical protein [Roseivirga sp.]